MAKSRRTKALDISPKVKQKVFDRDNGCCVYCGRPGMPNAHFIARSHSGLGIEENILTLCVECHREYDQTINRPKMREYFKDYLKSKYPDWDETKLVYNKWN